MRLNGSGEPSMFMTNPTTRVDVFRLAIDRKGDSDLRMADSAGKPTVVPDALEKTSPILKVNARSLPGIT
jgi:hypothetical protein